MIQEVDAGESKNLLSMSYGQSADGKYQNKSVEVSKALNILGVKQSTFQRLHLGGKGGKVRSD